MPKLASSEKIVDPLQSPEGFATVVAFRCNKPLAISCKYTKAQGVHNTIKEPGMYFDHIKQVVMAGPYAIPTANITEMELLIS